MLLKSLQNITWINLLRLKKCYYKHTNIFINGDTHDFEQSFNPKHETETHAGKTVRYVFLFKIGKRQIKLVFVR